MGINSVLVHKCAKEKKKRTWPISSHLDPTLGRQPIHICGVNVNVKEWRMHDVYMKFSLTTYESYNYMNSNKRESISQIFFPKILFFYWLCHPIIGLKRVK